MCTAMGLVFQYTLAHANRCTHTFGGCIISDLFKKVGSDLTLPVLRETFAKLLALSCSVHFMYM